MIGLTKAKEVIAQALDYYKAQKLFREKGICLERPVMHMVFTGNPRHRQNHCGPAVRPNHEREWSAACGRFD